MIFYILCLTILGVELTFGNFSRGGRYQTVQMNHENAYNCVEEGFHPDPRDCRKFYRCVNINANYEKQIFLKNFVRPLYVGYEFECPQGTIFNPDYNVCAHPQNTRRSECGGANPNSQPNQLGQYRTPQETRNLDTYLQPPSPRTERDSPPPGSSEVCTAPGYFPVKGNCNKFINCVDNGMGGFTKFEFACGPGTVWDPEKTICNHPYAVPGCGQGGSPEQGGGPGQGENPEQGGYPGPGGSPGQGGYPGPGGSPGQGGYPGPGGNPGQGGYPGPGGNPGQGGYPGPGGNPGQGGYPGPGGNPGQGGYPGPGGNPGQGGYPGPGGNPGQGGYPGPGGSPGQGGYPGPGGNPGQGGYPGPGGNPGQGGYLPGENPGQGGYPDSGSRPNQESTPPPSETGTDNTSPGECKAPGFFPVKGNCKKYIRCVDKGNGGYNKFEFECGPGTVWDSDLNTCNYPSSVKGCEDFFSKPEGENPNEPDKISPTPAPQPSSPSTTQPTTTFSPSTPSTPITQQSTTPSAANQMTTPSVTPTQESQTTTRQPEPTEQGNTQPSNPTTTPRPTEASPGPNNPNNPPPGSSPCDVNQTASPVKCEKEGFFPVPNDCKKFYRCVDWDGNQGERFSVHYFECAPGTIWDPALQTCNHEASVYPPRNCKSPDNQATEKPSEQSTPEQPEQPSSSTSQPESSNTPFSPANQMTTKTESPSTPSKSPTMSTTPSSTTATPSSPSSMSTPSSSTPSTPSSTTSTPEETEATTKPTETTDSPTQNPTDSSPETTVMSSTDSTNSPSSPETTTMSPTDSTNSPSSPETTTMTPTEQELSEKTDPTDSTSSATEEPTSPESTEPTDSSSSPESTEPTDSSSNPESTEPTDSSSSPESTEPTDSSSSPESSTEQPTENNAMEQTDSTADNTATEPSETSTPPPSTDPDCPELNENQKAFACPTGFKRHPKNCNMFYQCTTSSEMEDVNIVTFSCKDNTYFDEKRIQCLPPEKTEPCKTQGKKRKARNVEEEEDKPPLIYISANKKLCPKTGSFPYEGDCTRFYKCSKNEKGKIEGFMYQCPENYIFSAVSDRCEKKTKISRCGRSIPEITEINLNWLTMKVPTEEIDLGSH